LSARIRSQWDTGTSTRIRSHCLKKFRTQGNRTNVDLRLLTFSEGVWVCDDRTFLLHRRYCGITARFYHVYRLKFFNHFNHIYPNAAEY